MNLKEAVELSLHAFLDIQECESIFYAKGRVKPIIDYLRAALAEDAMKRLTDEQQMIERGTKAWAGVPDANRWVEELRGNEPVTNFHEKEGDKLTPPLDVPETNFGNMAQAVDCYGDGNVYRGQRSRDSQTPTLTINGLAKKTSVRGTLLEVNVRNAFDRIYSDHIPDATKMMATSQESRQVEPVAWRYIPSERLRDVVLTSDPRQARLAADYGCEVQPLYPAPPKRDRRDLELAEAYRCGWDGGVKAEREACAKLCDAEMSPDHLQPTTAHMAGQYEMAEYLGQVIRQRGEK